MRIRKATKKDAMKMSMLKKETFKKINSKYYPKKVVEEYLKRQSPHKVLENMKKGIYFALFDKSTLLGYVQLYDKNIIGSLYIRSSKIGKGYGKLLMDFIETYAKKKGIKKVKLHSTRNARGFYKKLGYKRTNKRNYWNIAGYKLLNYEMEKKI